MPVLVKPITFIGNSLEHLRAFPISARREVGFQLNKVQVGKEPTDWKSMNSIGAGVREIRIREQEGAFRIIYVTKIKSSIYILHCFQKKTQGTSRFDLELAQTRYKNLLKEFKL